MKIGVSTGCLYPELTEKSLALLTEGGFDLFEIFFNTYSELQDGFLNNLSDLCRVNNSEIVSLHPFTSVFESYLLFSGYERRFLDGVEVYDMYFQSAKKLGAKYVVLHGIQSCYSSISTEEYCRRFSVLSHRAELSGVTLLQENVYRHWSGDKDFIKKMKELLGSGVHFVLDTKQARRCGCDPCEKAEALGSSLEHIHISDCSGAEHCLLPGSGSFDFSRFFSTLADTGYSGDAVIEVYGRTKDDIPSLLNAKYFLEEKAAKLLI